MEISVSESQMKAIDHFTIEEIGISSLVLMERAALGIANKIATHYENRKIAILCGTGNNGGDGIAIGRILYLKGYEVVLYLVDDFEKASDQTSSQLRMAQNLNVPIKKSLPKSSQDNHIIIDALFGIGLNRDIDETYEKIITSINQSDATIIAVDIPSGLSADTGSPLNTAIKASKTYTIGFFKKGFTNLQAKKYTGEVETIDIGYPPYTLLKTILESEEKNE